MGHSLSPLPPKAALTVVPKRGVVGTEVDDRVCLTGHHHEGRLDVRPEHGEGRALDSIVAQDLEAGGVFLSVPELPVVRLLLDQVALVGHPEGLEVSAIKNTGNQGVMAKTFHLVRNKVTVPGRSSTSSRSSSQNNVFASRTAERSGGVQIVHHGGDDVPSVEVEVACLLRGLLVPRVLVAAAVRHVHLDVAGKGGVDLRGCGEDNRLAFHGVRVVRGRAEELAGLPASLFAVNWIRA